MSFEPVSEGLPAHLDDRAGTWAAALKDRAHVDAAARLLAAAESQLQSVPELARTTFAWLYRITGGRYSQEMKAWAAATGFSYGSIAMINCGYELDHALHGFSLRNIFHFAGRTVFGCSTGIVLDRRFGPVHVRTLDWPIAVMARETRRVEYFRDGKRLFTAAGFPAFIGVLSGLRHGGYSVTINWAPPSALADFHWGPTFLLRETLEQCATFDEARAHLSSQPLSTSVFYTLCGVSDGEACVIERTQTAAAVRPVGDDRFVTQTNHHQASKFTPGNAGLNRYPDDLVAKTTWDRLPVLARGLADAVAHPPAALDDYFRTLTDPLLANAETVQRMVICPRADVFLLERRT